jgi:hypothetical protein
MKYITFTFENTEIDLWFQPTAKYHDRINKFVALAVSPETVSGIAQCTKTTYAKLEAYIHKEQTTGNPSHPNFVEFMKELVNDGATILPDYPINPRDGVFKLDLFIRLTPTAYANGIMPVGSLNSVGMGAEGDAPEGVQRTWEQWCNMTRNGEFNHENETHKFMVYHTHGVSKPTHNEFAVILNHTASGFKLLSPNEFIAQKTLDTPE